MNEKKGKSKKKIIVVLLLMFTLLGVVGYGVYSYFWASGSISANGTVTVDGFNVTLYDGFLNDGYSESLSCEYSSGETFICSPEPSTGLGNQGTKPVKVIISNINVYMSGFDNARITRMTFDNENLQPTGDYYESDAYYSKYTTTLEPGASADLDYTIEIEVPGYVAPSEEATRLTSATPSGELQVYVSYNIKATENLSEGEY